MTEMDDPLRRARRAVQATASEMTVTWDDVLARSSAGETAPVVPLEGVRPVRRGAIRLAVAAVLVVGVAIGAAVADQGHRTQPAASPVGSTVVTFPTVSASPTATDPEPTTWLPTSDEAAALVDRARQALQDAAWCGVALVVEAPQVALYLDKQLAPVALLTTDMRRGRTADGRLVSVDDRARTSRALSNTDEMTADQPTLDAASEAVRRLATGVQGWRPVLDGTGVSTSVDGADVVIAFDATTGLPSSAEVPSSKATVAVSWLACDESMAKVTTIVTPDDYTDVSS